MTIQPLIIDSFAGGGGASTGIEMALGRSPDVAINHNADALALHAANHPETLHLNSNIWDVSPREVTQGRHVGLLWASPDCKHFSKAKGGAPKDRNIRDLAWVVVRWMEEVRPDVVAMENVEEFRTWGPIDNDGAPIREFAGQTFDDWMRRIKRAGYRVQWRELRACDYGAPTIRKRFFMLARRDGLPIVWPKPTHGDPASPQVRAGKLMPWRTAAECIDWALPCPSIFASSAEIMADHALRAVRPLADNTLSRIARGMKRYVIDADQPFLVNVANSKTTGRGPNIWPTSDPARTVTGSSGFALVSPSITRFNGGATGQDLRAPLATVTANSFIKRPGGAAPLGLLAPMLTHMYSSNSAGGGGAPQMPLKTVTGGGQHHALIAPALATFYGHTDGRGVRSASLDSPLRTVTTENRHALIAPHLMTMRNAAKPFNGANEPTHTITAGGAGLTLVSPVLSYAQQGGGNRPMTAPHHTICASNKDQNSFFAATMVQTGYGERFGQSARALSIGKPLGTVVAGGVKHAPVAAFLAQHNTGATGHSLLDPLSTVAASGSHQTPVAAWIAKYYGTGDGAGADEPVHTITTRDRMGHMQAELQAPPFEAHHEPRARAVADFLRSHGAWDGGEFVTLKLHDTTFVVVDIGMRMLTPRELFTAQGFPPDYVIDGVWQNTDSPDPTFRPFPKSVQVSACGNSVCPPLAAALISANCPQLAAQEFAA